MHSSINNEDMKSLIEFKLLISNKSMPKSIKILNCTVFLLMSILIILCCNLMINRIFYYFSLFLAVSLSLKSTQIGEIVDGMNSIHTTYDRGSNMADVNLQTRKLSMLSL